MAKHTHGPWILDGNEIMSKPHGDVDSQMIGIAHVQKNDGPDYPITFANALLMASAPELLALVKDLFAERCGQPKSCEHPYDCICAGDKAEELIKRLEQS